MRLFNSLLPLIAAVNAGPSRVPRDTSSLKEVPIEEGSGYSTADVITVEGVVEFQGRQIQGCEIRPTTNILGSSSTEGAADDSTTGPEPTDSTIKSVSTSGEIESNVAWDDDLADPNSETFKNTASSVENDLEKLFQSSDDVMDATVTVTGFRENSGRKRRQTDGSTTSVEFTAEVTVPASKSTDDIDSSVSNAIENADPDQFDSFDSFDSYSIEPVIAPLDTTDEELLDVGAEFGEIEVDLSASPEVQQIGGRFVDQTVIDQSKCAVCDTISYNNSQPNDPPHSFSNCVQGLKFTPSFIEIDENGFETEVCGTEYGYSGPSSSMTEVIS